MTRGSLRHGASPARSLLCFAALAAVVALPLPGHPAPPPVKPYTCISLGTLGGDYSFAKAVNDTGEVVGVTSFVPGTFSFNRDERAFAWKDANGNNASDPGEMVFLGSLGYNSWANGLNNLGEAVGSSKYSNTTDNHAILWNIRSNPPTMTDLNTLLTPADQAACTLLGANDINEQRQVAGWARKSADGAQAAFLLDLNTGILTDLGPTTQTALGMNDLVSPLVVGAGQSSNGFLFNSATGALQSLLPLTKAWSVNDGGEVAGIVKPSPGYQHPGYWKDLNGNGTVDAGEVMDLGTFGKENSISGQNDGQAVAITNSGLVVGNTAGAKAEAGYVMQRAFKWQSGTSPSSKADLNGLTTAPFVLRHARDVSSTGLIVGYGSKGTPFDPSSIDKAYLLKPNN